MEVGDGCDVPRATCQGACQEAGHVVDEVGDDRFDDILWDLGDWGRLDNRWLLSTFAEQSLDLGGSSVPKLVEEKFRR